MPRFTGKERDTETGLDYFGARCYGSNMGRFTSPDPREVNFERGQGSYLSYLADPQNWNRYAYVLNNSLQITDPAGRQPNKAQAATVAQVVAVVYSIQKANPGASPKQMLNIVDRHFRNQVDEPGAVRYLYTKQDGWIDLKHFFAAANLASKHGEAATNAAGVAVEIQQTLHSDDSAFSYEDIGSNAAGADFGDDVFDPTQSLTGQINGYLNSLDPTDPSATPNWSTVPREDGVMDGSRVSQSLVGQTPPSTNNGPKTTAKTVEKKQ